MRRSPLALALLLLLAAARFVSAQFARDAKDVYPNFDIRDAEVTPSKTGAASLQASQRQAVREAMEQAKAALSARVPTLQIEMNPRRT
ncbi:MAG: hypothetical protein ACJ8KX_03375, partial [Chthoniobacterales bacterium]